jgi:VCBS repeat-containing protein
MPETIDFGLLPTQHNHNGGNYYGFHTYAEDGFVITARAPYNANTIAYFSPNNSSSSYWRYSSSLALIEDYPDMQGELARQNGAAFGISSIVLNTIGNSDDRSVVFTATYSNGTSATVSFLTDSDEASRQTFTFPISFNAGVVSLLFYGASNSGHAVLDDILLLTEAVARDDSATTLESQPVSDNVFEDNGSGADSDPQGNAFEVTAVNGDSTKVGQQITLASGALLTLNADGTYTYNPNGAFGYLISGAKAAATGAVNTTATDTFTYTITGGDSATVTITIQGEDSADDRLDGDDNANTITGTAADETVNGYGGDDILDGGGGADILNGGDGNDTLKLTGGTTGANTPQEQAHGGAGSDHLILDYSALTEQLGLYVRGPDGQGFEGFVDIPDGTNRLYFTGIDRLTVTSGSGNDIITGLGGNDFLNGGSGDDILLGRDGDDRLLSGAGADELIGGNGRDVAYFGGDFGTGDSFNGGGNADIAILQGDYSARTVLTGITNLGNLGSISLLPTTSSLYAAADSTPNSYNLVSVDANVAAGQIVKVNGTNLAANENFTFDGSAETDGSFRFYGGLGTDTLTGGAQNDNFVFGHNGQYGAGDSLAGGAGYDVLYLRGDYVIDFTASGFGASTFNSIESIALLSFADTTYSSGGDGSFSYNLKWNDALLAAGQLITVNGSRLGEDEAMTFDGSLETDGRFRLFGGEGSDFLSGGDGDDLIYGNGNGDTLYGGGGNDVFRYQSTDDSRSTGNRDGIQDFSAGDLLDLSRIDADVHSAGDQAFVFVADGTFTGQAGQVRAVQTPGFPLWYVEADVDGDMVADLTIILVTSDQDPITAVDFIL